MKPLYPCQKVVAIDVDGTLSNKRDGTINSKVIAWCERRKAEGFYLILWSSRGQAHALTAAQHHNIADLFDVIISKPGYIVDDQGWTWIKHTRVINECNMGE